MSLPSSRTSKRSSRPASAMTSRPCLLDVTSAVLAPRERTSRTRSTVPSKISTPSAWSRSAK